MTDHEQLPLVETALEGGLLAIMLNRPASSNAVTPALIAALTHAVEAAEAPEVKAVLLRGEGTNFCAGADLRHFAGHLDDVAGEMQVMATGFHAMLERFYNLPKPVVAAVQGTAIGAGFGLVLAADHVIASRGARFSTGYIRLGLSADAGVSWFLAQALGPRQAASLLMTARFLSAEEAAGFGLVDTLVEEEALAAAAMTAARAFADGPAEAYAAIKALTRAAPNNDLGRHLREEEAHVVRLARGPAVGAAMASLLKPRAR